MKELARIKNNTQLNKKNVKKCFRQAVKGFFLWLGDQEITLRSWIP